MICARRSGESSSFEEVSSAKKKSGKTGKSAISGGGQRYKCHYPPYSVPALRERFKDIHNYIYANDRFKQHSKVFEEITKLLLAKLYDERDGAGQFVVGALERQAAATGDGDAFASRLQDLFALAVKDLGITDLFSADENLQLSPRVLAYAVAQLHEISLLETDAKGAAFQAIVGPQVRGEKGQFFTPDPVKRLITQIIDPNSTETILDPACGSGGLLAQAIDHVRRKVADAKAIPLRRKEQTPTQRKMLDKTVAEYASNHMLGIEIDPSVAE